MDNCPRCVQELEVFVAQRRTDRRIERTKRRLHEALLGLIDKKRYAAISIRDVTEAADVGRSTFYSHFTSKEELLFTAFERGLRDLATRATASGERGRTFHFSLPLLRHIGEQRRFALAMLADDASAMIRRKTAVILTDVVKVELERMPSVKHERTFHLDAKTAREAEARAIVGAYLGLVEWWLASGTKVSAEAVDAMFQQIATRP
jgi:AcrR family transcriptional regulator